ncbi:unnamed protein product [Notodromas monacha]|uniref:JmjC domain-containing protein n=1 Tax=Notodromas monacha TaxID=399045 RepID=A0A7R9BK32_9CRUS|nr:unnamed protein product [Notodromas monacha]CAG0915434.1 unnamed protein product [Notodromas monacha]
MTLPTIHVGMLFSTSCWYRDPHGLPWVEYLHYGAQKIWYSVPSHAEGAFRTAMQDVMPMHTLRSHSHCPIWLPSDSAMVPIEELLKRNVPVSRAVQEPGSFVVIFQKCFASSICCGYAVSESVNFAPSDWLTTCMDAFMMMEFSREEAYFSIERFLCNVATDLKVDANVLSQVPIEELLKRNVPVSRAVQEPGSFVVIFQKCFASSICCGYAVSESVNFAPSDWLTTCMDAFMMMEFSREEAYFSIERFLCNVATDLKVDANVLSQVLSKLEALYSKEEELLTNLKMRGVTFVRSSQNVSKNHEGVDRKNVKRSDSSRPKDASNDEVEEPVCDVCSRRSYFSWVETKSDMNLCLKHGERFLKKHPKTKAADIKVIIRKSKEEIRSCINKAKSRIMELSQRKLSKP